MTRPLILAAALFALLGARTCADLGQSGLARAQADPPLNAPHRVERMPLRRNPQRLVAPALQQQNVDLDALLSVPQMRQGGLRSAPGAGGMAEAIHEIYAPPLTAGKVRQSVDDALLYLRSQQAEDGSVGDSSGWAGGGPTALAALAMLAAGADPASDHGVRRAIDYLLQLEPNNTYVRGIRANVWEYALRRVPYDKRLRAALEADFRWLLAALGDKEGWRYNMESSDWDNSCTQYGVLGIWAAQRAGLDPGDAFWQRLSKHFRSVQGRDGGWSYTTGGSTANMATAGLASLFLVFDMHHARSYYTQANPRTFSKGDAAEVLGAIERGMAWLGHSDDNKANSYYLYGIERAGVASGRKRIGGVDWFAEGAEVVLRAQRADGSIQLGYGPVISTSLSTLFLVYGGAPVAINKLQYGQDQDWNLNPRDLANLSKALWSAYERPVLWQVVSIDDDVAEYEAPILFLSGSRALEFSDAQVRKLRAYVLRGGTLFAEPSDHSAAFRQSLDGLLARMFPPAEYPGYELRPLGADHGVYTVLRRPWTKRPELSGASDGARTFFFVSEGYLSADWQRNDSESEAFPLAMNLLFYATDQANLEGRFATRLPNSDAAPAKQQALRVARVRHGEAGPHPRDWDAGHGAWSRAAAFVRHRTGVKVHEVAPVALDEKLSDEVQVLHLSGRAALHLGASEASALQRWVQRGGTLLVDPWAGSPEFGRSARGVVEELFGPLREANANDNLVAGRFVGGADLSQGVGYKLPARRELRRQGASVDGQHLLVAEVKGRVAVVFSELDLSAALADVPVYQARGYRPESALQVAANLLGWLSQG